MNREPGRLALWAVVTFIFILQLIQLKVTYDVAYVVEAAWAEAQKVKNAVSVASNARLKATELENAVGELRAALKDLDMTLRSMSDRLDAYEPAEVKEDVDSGI